jgi:hypothetical protein
LGFATTAMGVLLVFVLGFLYGGWRSRWEKQMIIDGAVAYFANAKVLRPGLEDHVAQVRDRLKLLSDELAKLPKPSAELSKEQIEDTAKGLKVIHDNLILCDTKLAEVEKTYGYSEEERKALAWLIAQQEAELRRLAEAAQNKTDQDSDAAKPNAAAPTTEKGGPPNTTTTDTNAPKTDASKPPPATHADPSKK